MKKNYTQCPACNRAIRGFYEYPKIYVGNVTKSKEYPISRNIIGGLDQQKVPRKVKEFFRNNPNRKKYIIGDTTWKYDRNAKKRSVDLVMPLPTYLSFTKMQVHVPEVDSYLSRLENLAGTEIDTKSLFPHENPRHRDDDMIFNLPENHLLVLAEDGKNQIQVILGEYRTGPILGLRRGCFDTIKDYTKTIEKIATVCTIEYDGRLNALEISKD